MTRSDGLDTPNNAIAAGTTPRLHARALAILRRRIRSGALPAGSRLLESQLAQEFGVSRAPVRQALLALAAEGRITRSGGRGFIVQPVPADMPEDEADAPAENALISQPSWQPIYDTVEKAIVERISVASWRIVEVDMARHFGVSRTVAREVTARLHQRGLVKRDDKGRWSAPALSPAYVTELYELRWTLEPLALVKASERAPPSLLPRMRRNLDDAIARAATLSGRELDALEGELHVEFLGHCGNGTLIDALRLYQSLLVAHTFIYDVSASQFPSEPFLPEHARILEHLSAGDIASAAGSLGDHLHAACERAIARVEAISRSLDVSGLPYLHRL